MNSNRPKERRPRTPKLVAEALETRELMTGGVGDTFAILPATIKKAGGVATVSFNLDPKLFTDPKNKHFVLGIDVAPNSNATTNPSVVSVVTPEGKTLKVTHAKFDPSVTRTGVQSNTKQSSAATVTIPGLPTAKSKSMTYKVNVKGLDRSSGDILVGFYLPGDSSGAGLVDQSSINAIQYSLNANANDTTGKYSFDADANRDGVINKKDLQIAQKNLGVGTTVSPVISADLGTAGVVDTKNRVANVNTVTVTGTATPGSTLVYSAANVPTATTTADASGKYSIPLTLSVGSNTYKVSATDAFKQTITGSIAAITYTPGATAPAASTTTTATAAPTTTASTTTPANATTTTATATPTAVAATPTAGTTTTTAAATPTTTTATQA